MTPPAGHLLGREAHGYTAALRVEQPLEVRALAMQTGEVTWVLVVIDASLLCTATAAAVREGLDHEGRTVTVMASGAPAGPVLSADRAELAYLPNLVAVARAAVVLAIQRSSRALVTWTTAAWDFDDQPELVLTPRMSYLDVLRVSAGPRRPAILVAVAALPRLVDSAAGTVHRGLWRRAEAMLPAVLGEPVVVLGVSCSHAQEADPAWQRAGREELVAARLAGSLLDVLGQRGVPVAPRLVIESGQIALETLPLPQGYLVRRAADAAEIGCHDGNLDQRQQKTARWAWLERVYRAQLGGRVATVEAPAVRIRLGQYTLLGLGLDLSEPVVLQVLERAATEPLTVLSGVNGRAGALVLQPQRATVQGARELEPTTDLWPLGPRALGQVLATLDGEGLAGAG